MSDLLQADIAPLHAGDRVIRPWNNSARLSLSPGLYAWLALLVTTSLASIAFLGEHLSARFVLSGFILSHAIVFTLPHVSSFGVRWGTVSLLHVVCWTPGWLLTLASLASVGETADLVYRIWAMALVFVVGSSLAFDLRDTISCLRIIGSKPATLDSHIESVNSN